MADNIKCYIDIETTGLNCGHECKNNAEIIRVSAVKVINKTTSYAFDTFIKPKKQLTEAVESFIGIKNEDVIGAPSVCEALAMLKKFTDDAVLIAYNASFAAKFISYYGNKCGIRFENDWIDILAIATSKLFLKEPRLPTINKVCRRLGIATNLSYLEKTQRIADRLII